MHVARVFRLAGLTGFLVFGVLGTTGCGGDSKTTAPSPLISTFYATRSPITAGEGVTLVANFTNGDGSINHGVGAVKSGVPVTVAPQQDTTYQLTVSNGAGGQVTSTFALKVAPTPVAQIEVSQRSVIEGGHLTASVPEQDGCTYQWSVNRGVLVSAPTSRVVTVHASIAGTMTLTCTVINAAGKSHTDSTDVTVYGTPRIVSFTASAQTTPAGTPVLLTAVYTGGNGVLNTGQMLPSGQSVFVTPLADTQYTLAVTGASWQTATASLTVRTTKVEAPQGFDQNKGGGGFQKGAYDLAAAQPIAFGWTRFSAFNGPQTANLKWSVPGVQEWKSSPVIGRDGTVYVGGQGNQTLFAFNPDGTEKWRRVLDAEIWGSPALAADGTVYIIARSLYAFAPDGTQKWLFDTGNISASGVTVGPDGTLYTANLSRLFAVNPNGTVRWQVTQGGVSESTPVLAEDGTVVSCTSSGIKGYRADGTLKWSNAAIKTTLASPLVTGRGSVLVGTGMGQLVEVSLATGAEIRSTPLGASADTATPAMGPDGVIYIGTNRGLVAVQDGAVLWTYATSGSVWSSPLVGSDGVIYFGSNDPTKSVIAVRPNGTLLWSFAGGAMMYSSPALGSDGTLYLGERNGRLFAFHD